MIPVTHDGGGRVVVVVVVVVIPNPGILGVCNGNADGNTTRQR